MRWAEVILTDWQKQTFFNPRRGVWRLICVRLRSRVPLMDQLCHTTRSSWAARCSRATWTAWPPGATGSVCHCVRGGKPWLQFGGHSAPPAEWVCYFYCWLSSHAENVWFIVNHHFQAQGSEAFLASLVLKGHRDHKVHREATAPLWPSLGRRSVLRFRIICSVRLCCGTSDQVASSLLEKQVFWGFFQVTTFVAHLLGHRGLLGPGVNRESAESRGTFTARRRA